MFQYHFLHTKKLLPTRTCICRLEYKSHLSGWTKDFLNSRPNPHVHTHTHARRGWWVLPVVTRWAALALQKKETESLRMNHKAKSKLTSDQSCSGAGSAHGVPPPHSTFSGRPRTGTSLFVWQPAPSRCLPKPEIHSSNTHLIIYKGSIKLWIFGLHNL